VDLAACEAEINRRNEGRLEVLGLHWTEKPRVQAVKEARRAKEYRALVRLDGEPEAEKARELVGKRFTVAQRTPGRVAHRRADLERERWVEVRSIEPAGEGRLEVVLRTQHGTYVKEAISGEDGATRPSLSELLGARCECLELDVTGILDEEGVRPDVELRAAPARRPFGADI
jgi:tRNA pseudouridine synthase 10